MYPAYALIDLVKKQDIYTELKYPELFRLEPE